MQTGTFTMHDVAQVMLQPPAYEPTRFRVAYVCAHKFWGRISSALQRGCSGEDIGVISPASPGIKVMSQGSVLAPAATSSQCLVRHVS